MKTKLHIACVAWLTLAVGGAAFADSPTAFALVKEGNRYIGEQSRNQVVQIRSEKSVGSLVPSIWYVVYYDPDATLKAVEVKFGDGQKMDVSHPLRLLEPVTGGDRVLESGKLAVDSDQALRVAQSQPLLTNLHLTSTQFWLQHGNEGPKWKIKFWASKPGNPSQEADVGDVYISAATGSVIRADLHPGRVD